MYFLAAFFLPSIQFSSHPFGCSNPFGRIKLQQPLNPKNFLYHQCNKKPTYLTDYNSRWRWNQPRFSCRCWDEYLILFLWLFLGLISCSDWFSVLSRLNWYLDWNPLHKPRYLRFVSDNCQKMIILVNVVKLWSLVIPIKIWRRCDQRTKIPATKKTAVLSFRGCKRSTWLSNA